MALTTLSQINAALPAQRIHFHKVTANKTANFFQSLWTVSGNAGSTPASGNGAIPTSSTAGALSFVNPTGGAKSYIANAQVCNGQTGVLIIYDRLWHNSGFSGTNTSAQTIATPPTITRPDSNGAQVELWLEVYTAFGSTGATFTATYTDQDGNTGQSATMATVAAPVAGQMYQFALAAGDTGVRTVSQIQLSGSTGTAGNFGLTLLRRLAEIQIPEINKLYYLDPLLTGLPKVDDSACLAIMFGNAGGTTGQINGAISIVQA